MTVRQGCEQLFHFSWSENLPYSSPSNHVIFAASCSVLYTVYIAYAVTGVWCCEVGICDARACVLFVSSRSAIVFNPSAGAITDHSQPAKDIDQYFKSQLCGELFV